MISIPGRPVRTCEGATRREWLRLGALTTAGVAGLGSFTPDAATSARAADSTTSWRSSARRVGAGGAPHDSPAFGRAKSCIVLFLFGAPAHQDTWDLKPDAPSEVRGEFGPIATNVPDVTISEHLPLTATRVDRLVQLRAVTHPDNTHTVAMHYMLSGVRHARPATNPQNAADDFPCFGAVLNHLDAARGNSERSRGGRNDSERTRRALPAGISLNAPANQVSANNHIFPGFFAGFLGAGHDPLFVPEDASQPNFAPFATVEPSPRLLGRQALRALLESRTATTQPTALATRIDAGYDRAFELLTSPAARQAFDIEREPAALRSRYGMTPFGQGCLLARRLVEARVPLVTVNWQRDDAFWDTHSDNFNLHKNRLLPNFDRGFSTLLDDLSERGLLSETLVVVLGEFGRTPKINANAGRDHWAPCNTVVLAGAGLPGGHVYGASDRTAAYPTRNPVLPEDLSATIYHLLGIAPETPLFSPEGRRHLLSTGDVLHAIL